MNTTTDLEAIRKTPSLFTWGRINQIHDIGSYTIVEYEDRTTKETSFHVYVDGRSTHNSTGTIEGALLIGMARKHLEVNEARYMAMGAAKLLGIDTK